MGAYPGYITNLFMETATEMGYMHAWALSNLGYYGPQYYLYTTLIQVYEYTD